MTDGRLARRRVRALLLLVAAIGAAVSPLVFASGQEWVRWWVSVVWPLAPFGVAVSCFRVSRRLADHERQAWVYFGLGCLVYGAGEINWSIYTLLLDVATPLTTLGDLAYFSFPLLYILGIWYYRPPTRSTGATFVQVGNLGITFSAVLLAYLILFHGLLRANTDADLSSVVILLGILSVSAAFFALINVLLYLWGRARLVMLFILIGLATFSATDIHLTYEILKGQYSIIDPISVLYLIAFAILFWAAFEQALLQEQSATGEVAAVIEERGKQWATLLPPFAVAGVLGIAVANRAELDMELLPYAAGALALFVVSLAVQSWSGFRIESRLRIQAQVSETELQHVNLELRESIEMQARIEEELRNSQRMEALGKLTGGVAHDFNNLLAVIIGNLELAQQSSRTAADVREFLDEASDAADRGSALTQSLLSFSRVQTLSPQTIDVGALLLKMKGMLERILSDNIEISIDAAEHRWHCVADPIQIENAVLNLSINARDAMPDGGALTIEVSNVTLNEAFVDDHPEAQTGSFVAISVRDTGAGMSSEVLSRVFEPFFTTKEVGAGTGLGLSMVYGFAKQSQGHVMIDSEEGIGTEVRLYLPSSTAQAHTAEDDELVASPRGEGESMLVVEDAEPVRKLIKRLLEELGYEVSIAASGAEALAALDSVGHLDLLLSDVVLSGEMSGVDLIAEAVRRRPGLRILLMSGYAPDDVIEGDRLHEGVTLLSKPFRTDELARAVRSVLDA